jgi:serine/threonine-protein kinase RsbW
MKSVNLGALFTMSRSSKNSLGKSKSAKTERKTNSREEGSFRQIIIPSSLDYLPKVDEYVERKLRKLGVDKDKLADIAISVTEAVTNAVVHGNKNNLRKKVAINLKADSSCVEITVEDEGNGFDPEAVQCPIEKRNILKQAGRGIFILKCLMDKVDFVIAPQKGTIVKMTKFLS